MDDFKYSDHHEHSIKRVAPGDPEQCQGLGSKGQCIMRRVPGSQFCPMHGGNKTAVKLEEQRLKNYRLRKFAERLAETASQPEIKSLREEIAILRVLIEERINQCDTPMDLMMQSNTISDLIMKVKATVEACHKLEEKLGVMMDKEQAIAFAMEISEVIAKHVSDPDLLDAIGRDLQVVLASKI